MPSTVPAKVLKRKAMEEQLRRFEALAAYANVGNTLADMRKFRLMEPTFYPGHEGNRIYLLTEEWPNPYWYGQFPGPYVQTGLGVDIPPFFFYRNLVRAA